MRSDAIFIGVEVDDAVARDAAVAAKLAEVCPVDIYAVEHGHVVLVAEGETEHGVAKARRLVEGHDDEVDRA